MVVGIARIAPGPFLQLGSGHRGPPYRRHCTGGAKDGSTWIALVEALRRYQRLLLSHGLQLCFVRNSRPVDEPRDMSLAEREPARVRKGGVSATLRMNVLAV
jgi:hypothetical protein